MRYLIFVLVALCLFTNASSAEFYNSNEIAIITNAAGENTFPKRIMSYEEIVDIVHDILYLGQDNTDQSQGVEIYSVSLLVYTEVPQYCVMIIKCNEPLAFATIYIDANTLEVIDITPEDYRDEHLHPKQ